MPPKYIPTLYTTNEVFCFQFTISQMWDSNFNKFSIDMFDIVAVWLVSSVLFVICIVLMVQRHLEYQDAVDRSSKRYLNQMRYSLILHPPGPPSPRSSVSNYSNSYQSLHFNPNNVGSYESIKFTWKTSTNNPGLLTFV